MGIKKTYHILDSNSSLKYCMGLIFFSAGIVFLYFFMIMGVLPMVFFSLVMAIIGLIAWVYQMKKNTWIFDVKKGWKKIKF